MALDKQIHLYALDTSCFYTDSELIIHKKLTKLYLLRAKTKNKMVKGKVNGNLLSKHLTKSNQLIQYFKDKLYEEFKINKQNNIIRELREKTLIPKNVVSIFESFLTRTLQIKTNELTKDLMIIQVYFFQVAEDIIKNGFTYNSEKYVLFSASAGQIRTKKFVVIKECILQKYQNTLMCGLSVDKINNKGGINANKYLAYYALANSATDLWEGFDIDKSIVVDDLETLVEGEVDFIDEVDYSITRKVMQVPITHTDGCGIMLDSPTTMVRLPWIKGLMVHFDFQKFIEKHPNSKSVIKDIYGKEVDIIAEDIRYIFTKSQFKMWKYYDNWEQYKEFYKKYNCTAGVCNQEEDYIPNAEINYQMLQTLSDMSFEEMSRLASKSVENIYKIGSDFPTMSRLLGITEYNTNKNYMQQAIEIYPELMRDPYNKQILKDVKKSLTKQAKAGKLSIMGKYTFLIPDVYAFCEKLFLGIENPKGLLKNGEVSCNLYKNGAELDCLRSPHLYCEHAVRVNTVNEITQEWFDTKGIYTSNQDLISKILQFDNDGDVGLIVVDKLLCKIAKRNTKNIVPLYYVMKKASSQELSLKALYKGLITAYTGGNIGIYSNNISKIFNDGEITQEKLNIIKLLCFENNMVIDMAKTLYKPTRPKKIDETIKQYTSKNLPHFFIYAKDKSKYQVEKANSSPMNMLETIIPDNRINFNCKIGKIDYIMLLSNKNFVFDTGSESVIELYNYYNTHKSAIYNHEDSEHRKEQDLFVYQNIKEKIFELPYDIDFIVDTLVKYLYTEKKNSAKKTLWACFGDIIVKNLKKNIPEGSVICPTCGKRFEREKGSKILYCSEECSNKKRKKDKLEWWLNKNY